MSPKQAAVRICQWSYSRYTQYLRCPFSAFCKFIKKLKEPDSPAMARGNAVHGAAEGAINAAKLTKASEKRMLGIDAAMKNLLPTIMTVREHKGEAEKEWAFDKDWKPVGWFDDTCWVRIKVDAVYYVAETKTVVIIDWKTGKKYDDHYLQRSLYAIAGLIMTPEAKQCIVNHVYADQGGAVESNIFERDKLSGLQKDWLRRAKAMLTDSKFAPKPNRGCRWCAFSKSKGGPCKF